MRPGRGCKRSLTDEKQLEQAGFGKWEGRYVREGVESTELGQQAEDSIIIYSTY